MANGGIIGVANTPTLSSASGVWSLQEQESARKAGIWPNNDTALELDFNETTTLDSRITFTRATSATFFNSSGVLSTATSGAARFDHRLESGVWVNKGLLIEEQRTNSAQKSEEFSDAYWGKTNTSVSADSITAPDGTTTADTFSETSATGSHFIASGNIPFTSGVSFTQSVFAKAGTVSVLQLIFGGAVAGVGAFANYDLANGVLGTVGASATATIENVGDGWYRCSLTTTATATGTTTSFIPALCNNSTTAARAPSYAGNTASNIYLWGGQYETGAFPTSYIKTTTASVTRNADVASMTSTNFSDWYNATEGTVFVSSSGSPDPLLASAFSFNYLWALSDNTVNERMQSGYLYDSGTTTRRALLGVVDNNVSQVDIQQTFTYSATATNKSASAYKLNDFAFVLDGGTVTTDTSGTLPTVDRLYLGTSLDGTTAFLNGHIAKFYFWNTRKPNSFLQNITS